MGGAKNDARDKVKKRRRMKEDVEQRRGPMDH